MGKISQKGNGVDVPVAAELKYKFFAWPSRKTDRMAAWLLPPLVAVVS